MSAYFRFSLFLLFLYTHNVNAQCMNGTYTIDPVSGNYPTFSAAVADLVSNGVCGPVEFLVKDAFYSEHITIPSITGASDSSRIFFQRKSSKRN